MAGVLVIVMALAGLSVLTRGQQGLTLTLRGNTVAGGSDVVITDVGENSVDSSALICTTDHPMCCNAAASDGTRRGDWTFPNNNSSIGTRGEGGDFYVSRSSQRQVLLQRRNNALGPLGMYCCEVLSLAHPDGTTICVNLVATSSTLSSPPTTPTPPPSPPPLTVMLSGSGSQTAGESYTLTCTASGGGSGTTTYQWRKGQTLLNGQTSQTLAFFRLSQDDTGGYTCAVMRGSMTTTSNTVTINVAVPTISVAVSRSGTPTEDRQYTLTCTVSGHQALMATVTYQWLNSSNFITSSQTSNQYTFNPVDRYDNGTYTCEVTVNSQLLTSNIVRQGSTTFQVTVLQPERPSFGSPTQSRRSVRLTWTQPSSGGRADSYTIVYTVTERNCNTQSQGGTRTLSGTLPGAQRSITIDNLEENSNTQFTVTATNIRGSSSRVTTPSTSTAMPTGLVQNVMFATGVTTSTIRIQWGTVSCLERNGEITGYRIQYGITTTSENSQTLGTDRFFTATGLRPLTTYMFSAAAVNSQGTGPFIDAISTETLLSPNVTLWHHGASLSNQSIVSLEEIRGGSDLFCFTNYDTGSTRVGSWYFPDGTEVPQSGTNQFVHSRGRSFVALTFSGSTAPPSGLYRCVIPGSNGQEVTLFAAIYPNGQGAPFLPVPLQYNFARRTINCTSTRGPATTVEWTIEDGELPSDITLEQQLIDTETATYYNLLTITSSNIRDYTGRFRCRVRNSRGQSNTRSLDPDIVGITGNREFQLGETTGITCSTPASVQSIQWVDESNTVVRNGVAVQELRLDIMITTSSNNTRYTCRVSDVSAGVAVSEGPVIIEIAGMNGPRIPDVVTATSTQFDISISWSFTTLLNSRNETFVVLYGTTSGELSLSSPPVQSVSREDEQQYSTQLEALQPGTRYYYQIQSTNTFTSLSDVERSIKTLDARSAMVRFVDSERPNNRTLILNWQVPATTNGDILTYIVRISLHAENNIVLSEENVSSTRYTASNLSPGVPYQFSIIPVNLAGQGEILTTTYFAQELAPDVEVLNVMVDRTSPTTMDVSWRSLTLSEARGFVTFYSIAYTPTPNSRRRQASQDTMYVNASADSSSVTIQGLDGDLAYSVTVAAATRAGIGVYSIVILAEAIPSRLATDGSPPDNTAAIVGGAVAMVLILAIAAIVITVIVLAGVARERHHKTPPQQQQRHHAKEADSNDSHIYNTIDGPSYEVVKLDSLDSKHDLAGKDEEFSFEKCPAYAPTSVGQRRKIAPDQSAVYETVKSK